MARSRRTDRSARLVATLLLLAVAPAFAVEAPAELRFSKHGERVATRSAAELRETLEAGLVTVHEPYESALVSFAALPFAAVLDAVYGPSWRQAEEILFTCSDGYQPVVPVSRFVAHAAWLAFDRADQPGFAIDKLESGAIRRVELGPFYLVWENQDDVKVRQEGDYGWPYQLVGVDLIRRRDRFPRMSPPPDAPPEVRAGFAAFRVHCSKCHTVNGEGGTLGPELVASASPLAVRNAAWLRGWIDDPAGVRPGTRMEPLNPLLPDRERTIAEILAYLEVMVAGADVVIADAPDVPVQRLGRFEAFYASPLQHPWLLFAAAVAGLGIALSRRGLDPGLRRCLVPLGALSLADAWLTSAHVFGIGTLSGQAARFGPLFFVLAGDFRFLLLLCAATPAGGIAPTAPRVGAALGLTLVVPLATQVVLWALPDSGARVMFLAYELAFFALTLVLVRAHPQLAAAPWLGAVCRFVLLYYGLWATADVVILATGNDAGFALRVVPNVLYYGGLIAAIGWAATRRREA